MDSVLLLEDCEDGAAIRGDKVDGKRVVRRKTRGKPKEEFNFDTPPFQHRSRLISETASNTMATSFSVYFVY